MARKSFRVQVELEIQSVTCPGVWLCPCGKVSLQMYMLGSCIQTSPQPPVFPVLINQRFVFYKTFPNVHLLSHLQKILHKEHVYAELIQWQDCEVGNVLATFETTLIELLFPSSCDVDLLMESSSNFPGIISPKIEICSKTTIDEVCTTEKTKSIPYVLNPKTLPSYEHKTSQTLRQKKVCHTLPYHRRKEINTKSKSKKKPERPPFIPFPKVEENLIGRKVKDLDTTCCCEKKKLCRRRIKKSSSPTRMCTEPEDYGERCLCHCTEGHRKTDCKICDKYNKHFRNIACPCPAAEQLDDDDLEKEEIIRICIRENRSCPSLVKKLKDEMIEDANIDKKSKGNCRCAKFLTDKFSSCSCVNENSKKATLSSSSSPRQTRTLSRVRASPRKQKARRRCSSNSIWERKNCIGKYRPKRSLTKKRKHTIIGISNDTKAPHKKCKSASRSRSIASNSSNGLRRKSQKLKSARSTPNKKDFMTHSVTYYTFNNKDDKHTKRSSRKKIVKAHSNHTCSCNEKPNMKSWSMTYCDKDVTEFFPSLKSNSFTKQKISLSEFHSIENLCNNKFETHYSPSNSSSSSEEIIWKNCSSYKKHDEDYSPYYLTNKTAMSSLNCTRDLDKESRNTPNYRSYFNISSSEITRGNCSSRESFTHMSRLESSSSTTRSRQRTAMPNLRRYESKTFCCLKDFENNKIDDFCSMYGNKDKIGSSLQDSMSKIYLGEPPKSHPFREQIYRRSLTPCRKCLAGEEKSNTSWCPYYGTLCKGSSSLLDRVKTLAEKIQEQLSDSKLALDKYKDECDDSCNSMENIESDDEGENCDCLKNYGDYKKTFTNSLDKFYDSLYRKVQSNYNKAGYQDCACCRY